MSLCRESAKLIPKEFLYDALAICLAPTFGVESAPASIPRTLSSVNSSALLGEAKFAVEVFSALSARRGVLSLLISSWLSPAKKPDLATEDSDKSNVATTKLQKCLAGTNAKGVARSSVLGAASTAPTFLRSSRLRSLIFYPVIT